MQSLTTQITQFTLRGMLSRILEWVETFVRRKMLQVWIHGLRFPNHPRITRSACYEFSATQPIQTFIASRPLGVTVFWAPETTGKSFTLTHLTRGVPLHVFACIDHAAFRAGDHVVSFLYNKLGQKDHKDFLLSTLLPTDAFTTIVLEHFDKAMHHCADEAKELVGELGLDSLASESYNVLIVLNNPHYAHLLLKGHALQHARLLGPPLCGRWSSADLAKKHSLDPDVLDAIDQCGTPLPLAKLKGPLLQLKIAQLRVEWETGERLLAGYRAQEEVDC